MYIFYFKYTAHTLLAFCAAPPSYAEIVTEEQRQSSLDVPADREDLDGPLFAYIHEFRFQPPPLYSEVTIRYRTANILWILLLLV